MATLFEIDTAWKEHSKRRAEGGRHAIHGFVFQVYVSLLKFFENPSPNFVFESLSDITTGQNVAIQVKSTLTNATFKDALEEAVAMDNFLAEKFPDARTKFTYRTVAKQFQSFDFSKAVIPSQLEGRVLEPVIETDSEETLRSFLRGKVDKPDDFVAFVFTWLMQVLAKNAPSDVIAPSLWTTWKCSQISNPFRLVSPNLSTPPTHYIERTALLGKVQAAINNRRFAALHGETATLHAAGGFGKTVLATAYAHTFLSDYPGGVYFIPCEGATLEALLSDLLYLSDSVLELGPVERVGRVRDLLSRQRSLLILDNVESREQWLEFQGTGYLDTPNVDVLVTTRSRDIDQNSIQVEKLTFEETQQLLAKFRTSAALLEHENAIRRIWTESEGLAVLVAAIGTVKQFYDKDDDWEGYATWLEGAEADALPGEDNTNYGRKAVEIIRNLQGRLEPAQLRALQYSALLPADGIGDGWLEWLLGADAGSGAIQLGANSTGAIRSPSWHIEQLIEQGLIRRNEAGAWSVHRLHRRVATVGTEDEPTLLERVWGLGYHQRVQSDIAYHQSRFFTALDRAQEALVLVSSVQSRLGPRSTPDQVNAVATAHVNRGVLYRNTQHFRLALVDYGEAILIRRSLRSSLESQGLWLPVFQHDLARAHWGRGVVYSNVQQEDLALADYGEAIELMESLGSSLGDEWSPVFQNDLASVYMNRGNVYQTTENFDRALGDLSQAILIREGLRSTLEPKDLWEPKFRNQLAASYSNRGVARKNNNIIELAMADYDQAINIMVELQSLVKDQWLPKFRIDLAGAFSNRGTVHAIKRNFDLALADYGQSIEIMEKLRSMVTDQWSPVFQNELAGVYANRGNAHDSTQNFDLALADYDRAIEIMKGLRSSLEPRGLWHKVLRNGYAKTLRNRANSYDQTDPALAAADRRAADAIDAL